MTARHLGTSGGEDVRPLRTAIFMAVADGGSFKGYFDDDLAATLFAVCLFEHTNGSDLTASILAAQIIERITAALAADGRSIAELRLPTLRGRGA
jgi:hypothetical protein